LGEAENSKRGYPKDGTDVASGGKSIKGGNNVQGENLSKGKKNFTRKGQFRRQTEAFLREGLRGIGNCKRLNSWLRHNHRLGKPEEKTLQRGRKILQKKKVRASKLWGESSQTGWLGGERGTI